MKRLCSILFVTVILPLAAAAAPPSLGPEDVFEFSSGDTSLGAGTGVAVRVLTEDIVLTGVFLQSLFNAPADGTFSRCSLRAEIVRDYDRYSSKWETVAKLGWVASMPGSSANVFIPLPDVRVSAGDSLLVASTYAAAEVCGKTFFFQGYFAD